MTNIIRLTEPAAEPVTLQQMYEWLRMDVTGSTHPDDDMLEGLIKTARVEVEKATRRTLIETQKRLVLPCFPRTQVYFGGTGFDADDYEDRPSFIELLEPPLIGVASVQYYDDDNDLTTLDAADYYVTDNTFVPQIHLVDGETWPTTYRRNDAVLVTYTCGYPAVGSPAEDWAGNVPESLKTAIKIGVQLKYDNVDEKEAKRLKMTYDNLIAQYKVAGF